MVRHLKAPQVMRRARNLFVSMAAVLTVSATAPVAPYDLREARILSWSPLVMEVSLLTAETADDAAAQIALIEAQERRVVAPLVLPEADMTRPAALELPKAQRFHDSLPGELVLSALSAQDGDTKLRYSASQQTVEDIASLRTKGFNVEKMDHLPPATGNSEWACLTEALYFEARGEDLKGQMAVAEVILNRVESKRFPDTVCRVISQGASRRNACQFSFKCDGVPERFSERRAYERVGKVARVMLDGHERGLTNGATHYHTTWVQPGWSRRLMQTAQVGDHLFYRRPDQAAMN